MIYLPIAEICDPKQWPTIAVKDFSDTGFPVYGANGVIGFYSEFTHTLPTVLIGCRGSVGAINVTSGPAYVNGNAMALDNLKTDVVSVDYLAWFLRFRGFSDVISGSSQPQITKQNLHRVTVPILRLERQFEISSLLNAIDMRINSRTTQLGLLEELEATLFQETLQSANGTGKLGELGQVTTGKTPPTSDPGLFMGDIPFMTPGDLNSGRAPARWLSLEGSRLSRTVRAGSTLVCCIGATIGKTDQVDVDCSFNQQINAIEWGAGVLDLYGLFAVRNIKSKIIAAGASTTLPLLPKSRFVELEIQIPPLDVQQLFCSRASEISSLRKEIKASLRLDRELLGSLQKELFDGGVGE